jgi:hypothetical protein
MLYQRMGVRRKIVALFMPLSTNDADAIASDKKIR